ncbi:alpha-amylase family glycosyl hydrolase [Thiocystis violacea]|uniref:alpha-amylase family glycosyl hydrolase n=1 Tax=Thiocystis violacea TaxID=13725 RepID=UPI0019047A76|nr:alpha-amylase family glycosyl hydrolase [Thiocystis violacea]MBK1716919.1 alpha-amylase [Thiocystis violacea]
MKIYNLFPRLAGQLDAWGPHLERAARMGFDWLFVNPIQKTGRSGSLYSIADYFAINADFLNPDSPLSGDDQVRAMIAEANRLGLSAMIDLVINHCAVDSRLVKEHPEWFVREGGKIANPFCLEADGRKVVWYDLAQFDHVHSSDRKGLEDFLHSVIEHMADLGFRGFRCDAAYQLPNDLWKRLISRARKARPDVVFVAETLGCSPEQTRATAGAGFDAIFNSSKWWDFDGAWLLDQYNLTRDIAPSISFPESHDTERLFCESGNNPRAMKQRYLFSALFSSGVMIPIGFEYGFRSRLDVVNTRPDQWEGVNLDLTHEIAQINRIKDTYPVFQSEGPIERLDCSNPSVLLLHKSHPKGTGEALLALNKDPWNRQYLRIEDIYRHVRSTGPLRDVSLDWPMDFLPTPFEFDLAPGMTRILVSSA